jgi:hypothetical protein
MHHEFSFIVMQPFAWKFCGDDKSKTQPLYFRIICRVQSQKTAIAVSFHCRPARLPVPLKKISAISRDI